MAADVICEETTGDALAALGPEWVVLHDLRWPGRRFADIDHVVIGPGGIYVVGSKNWSGDVRVTKGVLRQNGYNREKSVAGVADSALALAELLGPYAEHIRPVLCFVQQHELRLAVREVLICSTDNVVEMVTSAGATLSGEEVLDAAARLDAQVTSATRTERGYAPGPHLWVKPSPPRRAVSRQAAGRTRRAAGRTRAGSATAATRSSGRSAAKQVVGVLVIAALFILLGIPMLAGAGQLVAEVVVEAASSS